MARNPILNGILQSDLDADGFKIINLAGTGNDQSGTIYVDPNVPTEQGEIGTTIPFKSLQAAIAAAPAGYNIIMRPALYEFDGQLTISRQVNIFGYGAIISPLTLGGDCGLIVSASFTTIRGISFAGGVANVDATDVDTGAIEVLNATNVTIEDCIISGQNGVGIALTDRYSAVTIQGCLISSCKQGITGGIGSASILNINIRNNVFTTCRFEAIKLTGVDNAGDVVLRDISIHHNEIVSNNASNLDAAAINVDAGAADLAISDNWIFQHFISISLTKVLRGSICTNVLNGAQGAHILLDGYQQMLIGDNIIDGRNPSTGNPSVLLGIQASGIYASALDAGPLTITGNTISGTGTSGVMIDLADGNDILINGNNFSGQTQIHAATFHRLKISSNIFTHVTSDPPITLNALATGWSGATINGNTFNISGAPTRLIATTDSAASGQTGLHIIGNASTPGTSYSNGIVDNIAGSDPTNIYVSANTPPSATGSTVTGWVNDSVNLPNQVIVSQERGFNNLAVRESDSHPFSTIAAAMSAAVSGDTVYVKDGVFNELITAKDGVTVRFLPAATLVCTTANGCIISNADGETFSFYHEHAPITSSKAGQICVQIEDSGTYNIHAAMRNTGTNTGTIADAVNVIDSATVRLYGDMDSVNGRALHVAGGSPSVTVFPGLQITSTSASAVSVSAGLVHIDDANIFGGDYPVIVQTDVANVTLRRCSVLSTGTAKAALRIVATSTTQNPVLRDCILIAESTATQSISATAAQTVVIAGTVIGNKGPNPPTNVTFDGGGTYAVDAGAIYDGP